jgi:hypothetical protein
MDYTDKKAYRVRLGATWSWTHQGLFGSAPLSPIPDHAQMQVELAINQVTMGLREEEGAMDPDRNSFQAFEDGATALNGGTYTMTPKVYTNPHGERFGEVQLSMPLAKSTLRVIADSQRDAVRKALDLAWKRLARVDLADWPSDESFMSVFNEPPEVRLTFHVDILPIGERLYPRETGLHVSIEHSERADALRELLVKKVLSSLPVGLRMEVENVLDSEGFNSAYRG